MVPSLPGQRLAQRRRGDAVQREPEDRYVDGTVPIFKKFQLLMKAT